MSQMQLFEMSQSSLEDSIPGENFFDEVPISAYEDDAADMEWDGPEGHEPPARSPFMDKALSGLNEGQREAVRRHEGKLLVIAGPGSGKTHTLTTRCADIINKGTVPGRVLLVTFTRKAAQEMAERAQKLHPACKFMKVGTFHSIALDILKRRNFGGESRWSVLLPPDVGDAFHACVMEYAEKMQELCPEDTYSWKIKKKAADIKKFLATYRGESKTDPFPKFKTKWMKGKDEEAVIRNELDWNIVMGALDRFPEWKRVRWRLEFDDIVPACIELLKKRDDLRNYFQYVSIDEFQDTSTEQAEFAKLLSEGSGNLMVVGDDCQSIYEWRGACVDFILEMQKELGDRNTIRLQTNYRSCPKIVYLTNRAMGNITRRAEKILESAQGKVEQTPPALFASQEDQAKGIYSRIQEALDAGVPPHEICVLFRSHKYGSSSPYLQRILAENQIPFRLSGGIPFFERKEVRQALAFLRLSTRPSDLEAWSVLLNTVYGIGEVTLFNLSRKLSRVESLRDGAEYLKNGHKFRADVDTDALHYICDLLTQMEDMAMDASGVLFLAETWVSEKDKAAEGETIVADVSEDDDPEDADGAAQSLEESRKEIFDYLNSLCREGQSSASYVDTVCCASPEKGASENGVALSTIHSAKGLEWDVVFVADLYEGFFPSTRSQDKWLMDVAAWRRRNNLPWLPPSPDALEIQEGVPQEVVRMYQESTQDEEKRLFYVAISRARKHLFLSSPTIKWEHTKDGFEMKILTPSTLLSPLFAPESLVRFRQQAGAVQRDGDKSKFTGFAPVAFEKQKQPEAAEPAPEEEGPAPG